MKGLSPSTTRAGRAWVAVGTSFVLSGSAAAHAQAQAWPSRPIRMIVASPPAGPSDILARLLGPQLTLAWGQTVLIDNRAGANGMIAAELTAKSDPDGHTILLANAGFVINTSLYKKVPYDPLREFVPISLAMSVPNILVVHPSVPARSVAELVAYAKAKPGQLAVASAGSGSSGHLALELFQQLSGVSMIHVPFKGGGPALADVMAGQTQALFSIAVAAMPQIRAGRVRALGVTSAKRLASASEIPTVAESGFPNYEVNGWFGFVAPVKTPRSIVARLNTDIVRALRLPELQDRLAEQGAEIIGGTPEAFGAYLKSEQAKWEKVIRQAGIKVE
ncbi:MAG: tripartite tricarboxylate transporter substrate binding protein [Proteobacteria bacterium]|nr:tripartite tricarboxylate transporter substrate binding protein [Burkholderiales bacterium]